MRNAVFWDIKKPSSCFTGDIYMPPRPVRKIALLLLLAASNPAMALEGESLPQC
jgi:hypothetical protein